MPVSVAATARDGNHHACRDLTMRIEFRRVTERY